jgi:uncharacterized protein (TIGR03000 family)
MQSFTTLMQRRRWRIVFGASLLVLAWAGFTLPASRAELRNSGARVQSHRYRDDTPVPISLRRDGPPSYYPDNDFSYPADLGGGAPASALQPVLPWNQPGFAEYRATPSVAWDSAPASPANYSLELTPLPYKTRVSQPSAAVLIAHLPEQSRLWVEDIRIPLTGRTNYFRSPLLIPGRKYNYTVRASWIEEGRWVRQTRIVPIRAGLTQTVYLEPITKRESRLPTLPAREARITSKK